ncbi:SMI1/KNR4 family protein [Streptomyces sp. NPDC014734]|uniref:SMI1/KNR4 family protein n=1 Tax=Streptomyces sp. NPDC014734 TaxID=3364886 RepID=UPI0036FA9549
MSPIHDFATWEPLLRLLRDSNQERLAAPDGQVSGQISTDSWSVPVHRPSPPRGRAAQVDDMQAEFDAVERVRSALAEGGAEGVSFVAQIAPGGKAVLHLLDFGPAVQFGTGPYPGSLVLVEDAVPEPWRRLPEVVAGAAPAPTADPALLERVLRERLPDAVGATEREIAAAEDRLGMPLPEELRAVYRVTRAHWEDWGDDEAAEKHCRAVGCELLPLDELYVADARSRSCLWEFGAMEAVVTPPDARVQGLVGSPGWIAFGDNGGGDRLALDLTPGPRGHLGQIVMLSHEENIGAELIADSLTDLVAGRYRERGHGRGGDETPAVARVNIRSLPSVRAAAHPALEVLGIGVRDDEPVGLAPVVGLPRLRTLSACPGTLADPLEIAELTGLEFLELGPEEWRALLDADAVPRGLSAAAIEVRGDHDPLVIADLANEILGLCDRPPIARTIVEGDLGPVGRGPRD